ncbi:hypothetical protein Golomagni_01055 [Golovinomyces magnicellulatus]|nr:hypothetical protein Golomagni_01055 [Golovinomyces magnicellulatus]
MAQANLAEMVEISCMKKTRYPIIRLWPELEPRFVNPFGSLPDAEEFLNLRRHRVSSLIPTPGELVDIRAAQRTFEGAYVRTALGQFTFALMVLKIFTLEFYGFGVLFAVYGMGIFLVSLYRRHESNGQFFKTEGDVSGGDQDMKTFRTSGNVVILLTGGSVMTYAALLILTARLSN